jgi:hypothetical protein
MNIKMVINMKENGKTGKKMEKAHLLLIMVINMLEILKMIK